MKKKRTPVSQQQVTGYFPSARLVNQEFIIIALLSRRVNVSLDNKWQMETLANCPISGAKFKNLSRVRVFNVYRSRQINQTILQNSLPSL